RISQAGKQQMIAPLQAPIPERGRGLRAVVALQVAERQAVSRTEDLIDLGDGMVPIARRRRSRKVIVGTGAIRLRIEGLGLERTGADAHEWNLVAGEESACGQRIF